MVPIYTRIFSPDEYGVIEIITTVTAFLVLFVIAGLDNGMGRYYTDSISVEDKRKTASSAILYLAISSSVIIIIMILISGALSDVLFNSQAYSQILVFALACVPFVVLVNSITNLMRFKLQPIHAVVMALGTILLQTALILLFVAILHTGIVGIYIATLITQVVFTAVGFLMTKNSYSLVLSIARLKQMLSFGLPYVFLSLCYFLMTNSDRYFINYYRGLTELGIYGIGYKLASVVGIAVLGFQLAWGPFILSTYKDDDAKQTFARVFDYVSIASCMMLLGLSLFSRELLYLFATPQYFDAYKVVPFISAGLIIYTLGGYFSVGIGLSKQTIHVAWTGIIAAVVNLALNWLLIPSLGMMGAAISAVISFFTLVIPLMLISQRLFKIPYRFGINGIMFIITASVIAIVYLFLMNEINWLCVGIKVLLLMGFMLVPFALKLLGVAEVRYLYGLIMRMGTKHP